MKIEQIRIYQAKTSGTSSQSKLIKTNTIYSDFENKLYPNQLFIKTVKNVEINVCGKPDHLTKIYNSGKDLNVYFAEKEKRLTKRRLNNE